ncbi:MAG: DUF4397 domain-containing protein [Gemmatimonadaceae bacterium]
MRKYFVAATLALGALAACDDNGTEPTPQARVRVVQAVANVASADVMFGTDKVKAALAYKGVYENASTPAGAVTVKVRKAGGTADLVSAAVTAEANKLYTVVAFGTEAAPQQLSLVGDATAPAAGKAKVRIVHAAAGQAAVDVYVVKVATDLATATALKTNLAAKSASDYLVVDANATYVVILTTPGTRTPVLTVPAVALTDGKAYTVVAVEKAGGGAPLESVVLTDR